MQVVWRRGRIAAAAAGLGFVGVLVLAAVFRADIEAWYHLERMERDPAHFMTIAGEAEGTPEWWACERYLSREEGKLALLRNLAAELKMHSFLALYGWTEYSLEFDAARSTMTFRVEARGRQPEAAITRDYHEIFGKGPGTRSFLAILRWLPALGPGQHALPEGPTTYEITRGEAGEIAIRVRNLTPPTVPPASTPPFPPSTGTSAG